MAGFLWLAVIALSAGGFGVLDLFLVSLFAVTLPWFVIGFWNATIGLLIMRFARDPIPAVLPVAARVRGDEPITASTAILLCIRNEPPERVARLLEPMLEGLSAAGVAEHFHVYVLSDTSDARYSRSRAIVLRGNGRRLARSRRPSRTAVASPIPATKPETSAISASAGAASTNLQSCSMPTAS